MLRHSRSRAIETPVRRSPAPGAAQRPGADGAGIDGCAASGRRAPQRARFAAVLASSPPLSFFAPRSLACPLRTSLIALLASASTARFITPISAATPAIAPHFHFCGCSPALPRRASFAMPPTHRTPPLHPSTSSIFYSFPPSLTPSPLRVVDSALGSRRSSGRRSLVSTAHTASHIARHRS
jgi:hypothetical protein